MQVGDVYYRRIDNCGCEIKGFFYLHYDGTMSTVVDNYKLLRISVIKHDLVPDNIHVLFHDDTVENLYTNLYMTVDEHEKIKEHIQKMASAEGLYSAFQVALNFPTLSIPDVTTSYELGYIESEQESYEGQHAEEPYWREEDLVPSKIETSKKFKLW